MEAKLKHIISIKMDLSISTVNFNTKIEFQVLKIG